MFAANVVMTESQDMQERNWLGPVAVIAGDGLGICQPRQQAALGPAAADGLGA